MRSSATEELLDDRPHLGLDDGRRTRRVDQPHALGLGATDLEIAPAHPAVEGERFALEAVEAPAADPPQPLGGIEVEEQREVGHDAPGRTRVQLADQVGIDTATVPLIGDGRVGVPVAEHDAAPVEPGTNLLGDVLLPRGHEEEHLDERLRLDTRTLEQAAHFRSESCAVRLARVLDLPALPTKPPLEPHHLGGLARPFDALERDQYAAHAAEPPGATIARGSGARRTASSRDTPESSAEAWRPDGDSLPGRRRGKGDGTTERIEDDYRRPNETADVRRQPNRGWGLDAGKSARG